MRRPLRTIQVARAVTKHARESVAGMGLGQILLSQARRRMANGGDSEHRYPDLWGHPGSFRRGGQPLMDTGMTAAGLSGTDEVVPDGVTATLHGPLHALYHQHGYKTRGPNFIPLTLKARRTHQKGRNPRDEGLEPWDEETGKGDYIMAWKGVDVPQRKIFNMPREDREEITETVAMAISKGNSHG